MNYEDCAVLLYNALTANNASGSAYGTTLGFTVSNGQVDGSTILLSSLKGPFVASESTVLPFVPASVYRNDKVSGSAELNKYDVYYYSESLKTLWVYTRRAAGRITEVSPSASAPAYGGRHVLHAGQHGHCFPGVLPQRRRCRPGGHPAAGHEQCGRRHHHR